MTPNSIKCTLKNQNWRERSPAQDNRGEKQGRRRGGAMPEENVRDGKSDGKMSLSRN